MQVVTWQEVGMGPLGALQHLAYLAPDTLWGGGSWKLAHLETSGTVPPCPDCC